MKSELPVTTSNGFENAAVVQYLGVVRGIVVRATGLGKGIVGGLRSVIGGNVSVYEEVCEEARAQAFAKMVSHAQALGADGIIGMRYDATEFSASVTEVLAYGTAVKFTKG